MRMTMVGTGYVGLVTGVCFANTGVDVVCLDVDKRKIEKLRNGICPIYEPGLTELMVKNHDAGRLRYTLDKPEAYRDADMIFICVGTPSDEDGRADLKYVLQAAADVGAVHQGPRPRARAQDRHRQEHRPGRLDDEGPRPRSARSSGRTSSSTSATTPSSSRRATRSATS